MFFHLQLNRVKVVAKEKDDLEGVKNEALGYLENENQITLLKNQLYQKFLYVSLDDFPPVFHSVVLLTQARLCAR
jgi:hypothetical protein